MAGHKALPFQIATHTALPLSRCCGLFSCHYGRPSHVSPSVFIRPAIRFTVPRCLIEVCHGGRSLFPPRLVHLVLSGSRSVWKSLVATRKFAPLVVFFFLSQSFFPFLSSSRRGSYFFLDKKVSKKSRQKYTLPALGFLNGLCITAATA